MLLSQNLHCLREYEQQTWILHSREGRITGPLFLAVRRPHRPVKPATVGHWLKRIMTLSGIDTGIFSPHSTRGAATSKAWAAGVSVPDILRAADWSSVSTFKRFYHQPVHSSEFGWVVLGSMQPIATQKSVSYKRYHVVNWLCCWKVSGTSRVQLQIPQGLLQSDEEDELYEEVEDTWRQHSQFPPLSSLPSPSFHRRLRLE